MKNGQIALYRKKPALFIIIVTLPLMCKICIFSLYIWLEEDDKI